MEPKAANHASKGELEDKECDDCGKKGVEWASINRGVLICSECCSVHRNLGRNVSFVKHLRRSVWDEQQLRLVFALSNADANRIWENTLSDPASKVRKPRWTDPIFPQKDVFIREKYLKQTFVNPKKKKNEETETESFNRQLFSCARSDYAHVALRLLAFGANMEYVDEETGDTALHVAAREGRENQVELFYVYGASLSHKNHNGETAADIAKKEGHHALAARLNELHFHVPDRYSQYLCGRKPDHSQKQDFLIPELTDKSLVDKTRASRRALQLMSGEQLSTLFADVYDEVDRREIETIWQAANCPRSSNFVTLFLPLESWLSPTRNQWRQKLAKCDGAQFATLLIDLLKEAKRRHLGKPLSFCETDGPGAKDIRSQNNSILSRISANVPRNDDYDEVAALSARSPSTGQKTHSSVFNEDSHSLLDELLEVKEKLANTEEQVATLTAQNSELTKNVNNLLASHNNLSAEYFSLREEVARLNRLTMSRRLPSPLTTSETPDMRPMLPTPTLPKPLQAYSRRESEDRLESGRWRSTSSDRRNSNDRRADKPRPSREDTRNQDVFLRSGAIDQVIAQGDKVAQGIRTLLQHGIECTLENNASRCAYEVTCSINALIKMLPEYVKREQITALVDSVVLLNAKCSSPRLNAEEICEAAHLVADKLRLILLIIV